jgi:hypothetical protein
MESFYSPKFEVEKAGKGAVGRFKAAPCMWIYQVLYPLFPNKKAGKGARAWDPIKNLNWNQNFTSYSVTLYQCS